MKRWSLGQVLIAAAIAVAAVVVAGFSVFIGRAKAEILRAAVAQQTVDAERTKQRVQRELRGAERALDEVDAGIRTGAIDPDDERAVESAMFLRVLADPRIEEVTFTRATQLMPERGDKPPDDPSRRQVSVFREADGAIVTRATRPANGHFEAVSRAHANGVFESEPYGAPAKADDPGDHDTFKTLARRQNQGRAIWTDLSWSERDAQLPMEQHRGVVSVQKTATGKDGKFAGILRVGLVTRQLDDLVSPSSSDPERQQVGRALLVSTPSFEDRVRLVARIDASDHLVEVEKTDVRVESAKPPLEVAALFDSPMLKGLDANAPEERSQTLRVGGEPWLATTKRLDLGPGGITGWMVVVIVPESHYTAELIRFRDTFIIGFAATLGLVLLIGALLLGSVRRGLNRIVDTTTRMRGFDFAPAPAKSKLREVDDVMQGLERAKTVVRTMGKYIPVDLVKRLYASNAEPELGGEPQEVSLMFTDIEGFTTLSERLSPDDLARRLGDYLAAMTNAIEKTGGTIDKYIGDAVMAIWNAPSPVPDHASAACDAALSCMRAARELYASPAWDGLPALVTRYGIHKAEVLVGHFGAPTRLSYTALGDGVNLAARLEPLCKQYGIIALVSEAVVTDAKDQFVFRRIDRVAVKGKSKGIDVYELLGRVGEEIPSLDTARRYEEAFEAYLGRDFERALRVLEPLCPKDRASEVLHDRCVQLSEESTGGNVERGSRRGIEVTKDKQRVLAMLKRHGWNSTSFQVLEDGFRYWFDGDVGCVAYVDTGGAWVAAGAPIAPAETLATTTSRFVEAAHDAHRRSCFFAAEERLLATAALDSMPIGEQPTWIPERWPETLRGSRGLREQLRRARAKGVTVRLVDPAEIADASSAVSTAMRRLIDEWLGTRKMAPMGFLVDVQPFQFAPERRTFVAEQQGAVVGMLVAVPIYVRNGWLFEDLLRSPRAPNGTSELLFDAGMNQARAEGSTYVTMGLAPLAGGVSPWLRAARTVSRALYDFDGVRRFKAKLGPHGCDAIYLGWERGASGTLALFDSLAAFTMRAPADGQARAGFMRFGLETSFASPALAIRILAALLVPWTFLIGIAKPDWFPSRWVQVGWVCFDVCLCAGLFLLAHRWRDRLARALAWVITFDAVLTFVQAGTFNAPNARTAESVTVTIVACAAPTLAALFLWGTLRHAHRRLQ